MPGGVAWNIPRGFLESGFTHFQSAVRETEEELGVKDLAGGLKDLPGEAANSNSTFFGTRAGYGFRYYGLHVPQSLLDCSQQNPVFRLGLFISRWLPSGSCSAASSPGGPQLATPSDGASCRKRWAMTDFASRSRS